MLVKNILRKNQSFSTLISRSFSTNLRAAVLLAGNGVYDGTEVTEAASLLIALSRANASVTCFAPNRVQAHVVNHLTGEEVDQERNVLQESARIARGEISDLANLDHTAFDALFVPGGFGAAKNLSDFGFKGAEMTVQPDVEKVLLDFHGSQKYIALCCISPILAAKVFGNAKLTLGKRGDAWPYNGSIDAAASFGNEMVEVDINEIVVDEKNRIVTAPAYMKGTALPHQIYDNVEKMVREVVKR